MITVLAALPILAVLVFMLGLKWSAAKAGVVAAIGTLILAVAVFGFGDASETYGVAAGFTGVLGETVFIVVSIGAIIGPALGIHYLQVSTGATERLQRALGRLTPDPRVAALLIAWFFALFMEGAAGFGTPVVLAAPFLVAAGFTPVTAVVAAMIGHAAGVSFGAIGTPIAAQAAISGIDGLELAGPTALFHVALGWFLVAALVKTIGARGGTQGAPWWWGALAGLSFFVPYGLLAFFVGPELPALGGALIGTMFFVAVIKMVRRREPVETPREGGNDEAASVGNDMSVVRATAPYLTLVALVLGTRLVPPINEALSGVTIEWSTEGGFSGSVLPLYHPGVLLTVAFGVGALAQRARWRQVGSAIWVATMQLGAVFVALVAMVSIARTMSHAGMIAALADSASQIGRGWPIVAPAVGALGTFMTGSATASNVLFTELQYDTALAGGFDVLTMLGAQGFGAAIGNIIAPYNIVAAVAVVELGGREGEVLRRTLPVAAAYLVLGGMLAWILTI